LSVNELHSDHLEAEIHEQLVEETLTWLWDLSSKRHIINEGHSSAHGTTCTSSSAAVLVLLTNLQDLASLMKRVQSRGVRVILVSDAEPPPPSTDADQVASPGDQSAGSAGLRVEYVHSSRVWFPRHEAREIQDLAVRRGGVEAWPGGGLNLCGGGLNLCENSRFQAGANAMTAAAGAETVTETRPYQQWEGAPAEDYASGGTRSTATTSTEGRSPRKTLPLRRANTYLDTDAKTDANSEVLDPLPALARNVSEILVGASTGAGTQTEGDRRYSRYGYSSYGAAQTSSQCSRAGAASATPPLRVPIGDGNGDGEGARTGGAGEGGGGEGGGKDGADVHCGGRGGGAVGRDEEEEGREEEEGQDEEEEAAQMLVSRVLGLADTRASRLAHTGVATSGPAFVVASEGSWKGSGQGTDDAARRRTVAVRWAEKGCRVSREEPCVVVSDEGSGAKACTTPHTRTPPANPVVALLRGRPMTVVCVCARACVSVSVYARARVSVRFLWCVRCVCACARAHGCVRVCVCVRARAWVRFLWRVCVCACARVVCVCVCVCVCMCVCVCVCVFWLHTSDKDARDCQLA